MYLKIGRPSLTVLVALACGFLWARSAGAQSPPSNLGPLKGEMKVFEAVIDGTMSQVFAPPFGVLQKTLGTYLPGFGLAFSLEVNLRPMPTATPFNTRPLSKAELEEAQKAKLEPSSGRFPGCWLTMQVACATLLRMIMWRWSYTFSGWEPDMMDSPANWSLRPGSRT